MDETRKRRDAFLASLPPEWPEDLLPAIQERARKSARKVVVLDDDPTGTQTVHGVPVLTEWPVELLVEALRSDYPAFYLLTNSRSLPEDKARALNIAIASNLTQAREISGCDFTIISRSDSTLRGHFPAELQALEDTLGSFDAWLVIPFFPEGGRFTLDDFHYVAEGEWLTPVGQTEFARDASFGYHSSNLREWVSEKSATFRGGRVEGRIPASQVASIALEDLRQDGPQQVARRLLALPHGAVCVVNACSYRDLEVLVLALLDAEAQGRRYLYRTAASFVRVRAGIEPQALLTSADLDLPSGPGGLVVAGSYVPKTTVQIDWLVRETNIHAVEVSAENLLEERTREEEIARVLREVNGLIAAGRDTLVYTSRALITAASAEGSLAIGRAISEGLTAIVRRLAARPRYLLAKGGITSSDIATRGLGIRRALVAGQVLPGVPVWQAGPESRFPELTYIVFPGNVGEPDALARVVRALEG